MIPTLPAIPEDEQTRWGNYFEEAEQLPMVSPTVLRVLESEDDSNPLTGYNLLEDTGFWVAYVDLLSKGATRQAAARSLGAMPSQVAKLFRELGEPLPTENYRRIAAIRRREDIADIYQRVITAEGQLELLYVNVIHQEAVVKGNESAAKYLLERRFKEQWAPNKSVVHKGAGQQGAITTVGSVVVNNNQLTVARMSDDQLAAADVGGRVDVPRRIAIPGKVVDVGD